MFLIRVLWFIFEPEVRRIRIMKKVSTASFIVAIILIVCSVVLNVLGFTYINGAHYVRHYGAFMQMTYTMTSSMANVCLGMIIAGGFLFIGGILLFMLSALTCCRPQKDHSCSRHEIKEVKEEKAPAAIEPPMEAPAEEAQAQE